MIMKPDEINIDWSEKLNLIKEKIHIFEFMRFDSLEARDNINDIRNTLDQIEKAIEQKEMEIEFQ